MSRMIKSSLGNTDHNMNMFSKTEPVLQNQFTKKPTCDLISQLISNFFQQIKSFFQGNSDSV